MTAPDTVIADTRRWLERAVVGLNLCPFAKAVLVKGQVHFAVADSADAGDALRAFTRELLALAGCSAEERDTTLLVVPRGFEDFLEFSGLVAQAERVVRKRGLEGEIQLASFHPQFQFADAQENDVTNFTNRSPYPILHLLREASLDRAVEAFPDPAAIYEANKDVLRRLGHEGWRALGVGPSE